MTGKTPCVYFGMSCAFEPAAAGLFGASPAAGAAGETGCDCTESCIRLPDVFGFWEAINASVRLVAKNTAARTAVVRLRKFAEPEAPNRLPDAPLPNAAPMSAPLPCCISTRPMMASATRMWTVNTMENNQFMFNAYLSVCRTANCQKIRRLQRCPANQTTIDVRLPKQLGSVLCLDTTTVQNTHAGP